nr:MFS transporter [Kribbella voronezhensis]
MVGALTNDFALLLVTRVLAALANAGFLAMALATATGLVAPDAKGRATSVLIGGTTLACIAGVPGGALLGQYYGWRAAFWAVALSCLPALAAIHRSVPAQPGRRSALRRPRVHRQLVVLLLLGALVNGATFCSFTYLAPVLTEVAGFSPSRVPLLLALFGVGSFAGVTAAGRYADRRPTRLLLAAGVALLGGWCAFALLAAVQGAAVVCVLIQGALSFAVGSTLIASALYSVPEAPALAGGLATAALNVGAALGPVLGGIGISVAGYRAPLWASAILVGLALTAGLGLLTALVVGRAPEGSG